MVYKFFISRIIMLIILKISNPLETKAANKNNMINRFCIASIKSKIKSKDKQKLDEISFFTCECFFEKYRSGSSIKNSRSYCKDKATEKFNIK